jgi:hypothetical protein
MGQKIKLRVYPWLFTMIFFRRNNVVTDDLESEVLRLLLETMILLVRCSGLEGAIIKTCAKLYQFFSTGSWESTPRAQTDFDDVRTASEFPVIRIPTRPTPVAAPRGRNVWNFSPLLGQTDENSQSDAQMICTPSLLRLPTVGVT